MSKVPLCLYVLWHPDCGDGRYLARTVYDWFHASSEELHRAGLGLPVYYRFDPENEGSSRPREIALNQASVNVVVPLVDANMVADPEWRRYLDALASTGSGGEGSSTATYPVALDSSAYRLPPPIQRVNYLRVDTAREVPAGRRERRAVRLRRQLTEVVCRHLYAYLASGEEQEARDLAKAPPLTVFLSHAKRDGAGIAAALRDEIFGYGQIKAFYDENDLPIGAVFEQALKDAASGRETAAMLSVVTDAYAGRPWCRTEVRLARLPRREPGCGHRWFIQPLVAVSALKEERTRGMPEIGNASIVQWRDGTATKILDLLVLESLLLAFHRLSARSIPPQDGRHVISWVPDLLTLSELSSELGDRLTEIVYPGHGLPQAELETYRRLLGAVRLSTFEEARD